MSVGSSSGVQASAILAEAASHSHKDCCKENGTRSHPIFDAIKSGMLIAVQTVVEQQGVSVLSLRDDKGHTPAHWACLGGQTAILRYMIENKVSVNEPSANELGAKPIHWACVNGHIAIVDILSQAGVDLDTMDNKNCTPLIVAAQYGQTMLAGYLMGKGARLQLTDKDGDNALHWAAFKGHSELMRLLIYSGFNPKQKDNYGQTALHLACINGNLTAVKELCEQDGVDIDLADNNGKTPVQLAIGRKHDLIVNYLKTEVQTRNSLFPRIDWWAIIFGPPGNSKGALLFLLINIVVWGYPMYIFKCLPLTWNDLQVVHVLFMFTNVIMWICLYHANTIDPGYLPRNIPEYDLAIKQVAYFDEWKQGQNPLSRLCHTCRTVKPLRAKHCRICNRCVIEFDHHCPYIHNCVGYYNRAWFLAFVFSLGVMAFLADYFCYYILAYTSWDWLILFGGLELGIFSVVISVVTNMTRRKEAAEIRINAFCEVGVCLSERISFLLFLLVANINGLLAQYFLYTVVRLENYVFRVDYIIAGVLLAFYGLVALSVFMMTIYHAANNLTTNERINKKRYDYLKDGKGSFYNPFDKGIKQNLQQFLHLRKALMEDDVQLLGVHVV